jgi:hypothetical protein
MQANQGTRYKTHLDVLRLVRDDGIFPEDAKIECCTKLFNPLPVAIPYILITEP